MSDPLRLAVAPSLDQLAADPARAAEVPVEAVPAVLATLAGIQTALAARLAAAPAPAPPAPAVPARRTDRLLTIREAASQLGMSTKALYHKAHALPFVVRLDDESRALRFSERGLQRYIAERLERGLD